MVFVKLFFLFFLPLYEHLSGQWELFRGPILLLSVQYHTEALVTIAISIKVDEGIVLVADSATTVSLIDAQGNSYYGNIYNNARKLFRLHDSLPVGAVTWGANNMGQASIRMLAKDFRATISDSTSQSYVDPANYTIEEIAKRFRSWIYDHHYQPAFSPGPWQDFGLLVAGYSFSQARGEVWKFDVNKQDGTCCVPELKKAPDAQGGIDWYGMPTSLQRLIFGFDPRLQSILVQQGLDQTAVNKAFPVCKEQLEVAVATDSMAIQDVIDLGIFLAETVKKFTRFCLGQTDSVGGPIEVAVITKYEGFKWVRRKHFYDRSLNE